MGCYNFSGVLEIIKGSIQILPKNGKIMASLATLGFFLYSSAFLGYFFIYNPLKSSFDAKNQFIALILLLLFLFIFVYVSRIISMSTIYVSAMSLKEQQVSFKNLYLRVKRSFSEGLIFSRYPQSTKRSRWFIIFFVIAIVVLPLSVSYGVPLVLVMSVFIVIMIPALVYSIYKSVASVVAYIILVIEENCDKDEALTKSEWLVKGVKVDGFVLNLGANLFVLILFSVYLLIAVKQPSNELVAGICLVCVAHLLNVFMFVSYTYLYFKCKASNGEEITFGEKLDHSDAVNSPLLDKSVP